MQVGCAGSFFMHGGGSLFLIVTEEDIADHEEQIQRARRKVFQENERLGKATDDEFFSWALAGNELIDIPMLVDLGNLEHLLGGNGLSKNVGEQRTDRPPGGNTA